MKYLQVPLVSFGYSVACWESCPDERRSQTDLLDYQGLIGVYGKFQIGIFLEGKQPEMRVFFGIRELVRPA